MNAMDHTIAGAASGETAICAAPKGSQSQAKGQKSIGYVFVFCSARMTNSICYSCDQEIGEPPISFFYWVFEGGVRFGTTRAEKGLIK